MQALELDQKVCVVTQWSCVVDWTWVQPAVEVLTLFPLNTKDHNSCSSSTFQFIKHLLCLCANYFSCIHTHLFITSAFQWLRNHYPYFPEKLIGLEWYLVMVGYLKGQSRMLFCFHYTDFKKLKVVNFLLCSIYTHIKLEKITSDDFPNFLQL